RDFIEKNPFDNKTIFGFTLTIRQTSASLYWSSLLKEKYPESKTVFGGNQCEDPMGSSLFNGMEFIDIMVRGEADTSLRPLFKLLSTGNFENLLSIPSIYFRKGGLVYESEKSGIVEMETIDEPDYSDFESDYQDLESITN